MLNVIAINGRLVADPELKSTTTGLHVCTFRVAVDRNRPDASGQRQADFFSVTVWRQAAEFVCRYFHKGDMIAIDGRLESRPYKDKDGNNRTAIEIQAANVNFCGSRRESGWVAPNPAPAPYGSTSGQTYQEPQYVPADDGRDLPF